MKKLFAFDIDGTLLDHKNNEIPASALKTINHIKEQGHIVGIASGRNKSQMLKVINPEQFDFIILCNGGYLEIDGKKVKDFQFTYDEKLRINQYLDELNLEYGITTHEELYNVDPHTENVKKVLEIFNVITPLQTDNLIDCETYQYSIYEHPSNIDKMIGLSDDFVFHSYGEFGFDIDKKSVNKGEMLKHVAEIFKINIKNTIAFGDADNDEHLLKIAGLGIALGNGTEKAKQNADYITTNVWDHGIYNAIKKFGYIN